MSHKYTVMDLSVPASNGLRRGRTTGSCAAAAVKAALLLLLKGQICQTVEVLLPDEELSLVVPVKSVTMLSDGSAFAEVVKDSGDDPDCTNGATISATVKVNNAGVVCFFAGRGVGIVTEPGIRVAPGEPAINPMPRKMMLMAVDAVLSGALNPGFDLTIGCERGEAIALRTFNPRLGIVGGISIIGTTGIVEPMSLAAYKASIEVYIRVALAESSQRIAFMPGNIGLGYALRRLNLQRKKIVHISNFLGFSLSYAKQVLEEEARTLPELYVLGHPGKIAKILAGHVDTHSARSGMATGALAEVAGSLGFDGQELAQIEAANTVEAVVEMFSGSVRGALLWREVEEGTARLMQELVGRATKVEVRLFSMKGAPLGAAL